MNTRANKKQAEIRIAGRTLHVPSDRICGRTVVVKGKWVKIAQIRDEEVVEGVSVQDPAAFIADLKKSRLKADCFTFAQRPPETKPKYKYHFDWDNWAAVNTASFKNWWEKLPQESRKNVRRAAKRGVAVKIVPLTDEFVRGVHNIYNEAPLRQGKRFWHFGKDVETVRRELATYLERSEFVGAYWNEELIGFIKMVYVDRVATLFHIVAMTEHHDKKPMNALIAKAVEHCEQKGISHFIYGQFLYGNKRQSSLLEFKRRNGFEQIDFPRYFVPMTLRGRVFVGLSLYRGITGLVPEPVLQAVLEFRAWCNKIVASKATQKHEKNAGVAQR